jgi:hypothetical protein
MSKAKVSQEEFEEKLAAASEMDWARLAAFTDGEGSILIAKGKRVAKGCDHPTYVLTLIVSNTDLRLIDWLVQTFGGASYFSHGMAQRKWSVRTCYSWRMFDQRAATILEHCLPDFIIKGQQASTGVAFRRLKWCRGNKVSKKDLEVREKFRNEMCSLNAPPLDKNDPWDPSRVQ